MKRFGVYEGNDLHGADEGRGLVCERRKNCPWNLRWIVLF